MSALAQHSAPTPAPGSTKIVLSGADLARVAKVMDADAGIFIDDEKYLWFIHGLLNVCGCYNSLAFLIIAT